MPRDLLARPWTEEEESKLLELLARGRSRFLIAHTLRRTPDAVNMRIRHLLGSARAMATASTPTRDAGLRTEDQAPT